MYTLQACHWTFFVCQVHAWFIASWNFVLTMTSLVLLLTLPHLAILFNVPLSELCSIMCASAAPPKLWFRALILCSAQGSNFFVCESSLSLLSCCHTVLPTVNCLFLFFHVSVVSMEKSTLLINPWCRSVHNLTQSIAYLLYPLFRNTCLENYASQTFIQSLPVCNICGFFVSALHILLDYVCFKFAWQKNYHIAGKIWNVI